MQLSRDFFNKYLSYPVYTYIYVCVSVCVYKHAETHICRPQQSQTNCGLRSCALSQVMAFYNLYPDKTMAFPVINNKVYSRECQLVKDGLCDFLRSIPIPLSMIFLVLYYTISYSFNITVDFCCHF